MKVETLLEAMEDLDLSLIEESESYVDKSDQGWKKYWKPLAACACLVLIIGSLIPTIFIRQKAGSATDSVVFEEKAMDEMEEGFGVASSNALTESLSFNGKNYSLCPDEVVSDKDVGQFLGKVTETNDLILMGCEVYDYPGHEDQILIKTEDTYLIYQLTE